MTIPPRVYTLLWDGHSIVGVITGLALFVMFFCGALALYRGELHQWMDPALRTHSTDVASIDALIDPILEAAPPRPRGSLLLVWPFGNRSYFYLQYESTDGRRIAHWVVPHSGATLPYTGRSILPELLNELHFLGQLGTAGQMTAGVLGFVLLFVLVTGVAIRARHRGCTACSPASRRASAWASSPRCRPRSSSRDYFRSIGPIA